MRLLIVFGWIAASGALATTGAWPELWMRGVGAARLASELKADPRMCGLALYDVFFVVLPGRDRLVGNKPLFAFDPRDPLAGARSAGAARTASNAFNRMLAFRSAEPLLPADFTPRDCADIGDRQVCIFGRDGTCNADAAASFALNDVLKRINF